MALFIYVKRLPWLPDFLETTVIRNSTLFHQLELFRSARFLNPRKALEHTSKFSLLDFDDFIHLKLVKNSAISLEYLIAECPL